MLNRCRFPLVLCALAVLAGCAGAPHAHDDAEWAPTPPPVQQVAPAQADGSIYHDAQNLELFSDPRAHRVGDILTVALVESTQASKKATTSTSKTDKAKKDASLSRARMLFPTADLDRAKDHNRAEALLIAHYGQRCGKPLQSAA